MMRLQILYIGVLLFLYGCNQPNNKRDNLESEENAAVWISNSENSASCVFLTKNQKDIPVISWVEISSEDEKHFFYAVWETDKGEFGNPKPVPTPQNTSVHEEGMPKIAFKEDGTIFVIFETSTPVENSRFGQGDILYTVSSDEGNSWAELKSVYTNKPDDASISFSGISRLNDGEIGMAWLGTSKESGSGRPVLFAKTENNDFLPPVFIDNQACECCRIAVSSDTSGIVSVAYRDLLPGSIRDITISHSSDNGKTFHRLEGITNDNWEVYGCPHNGPTLKKLNDRTYMVWASGGDETGVHYAEYDLEGNEFNRKYLSRDGMFIGLSLLPDGSAITAYNENYAHDGTFYSGIKIHKINTDQYLEKQITSKNANSSYPVLETVDEETVILAWKEDNDKTFYQKINVAEITRPVKSEIDFDIGSEGQKTELFTDPVCGMELKDDQVKEWVTFDEREIGFCSGHCKEVFLQEPDVYLENLTK